VVLLAAGMDRAALAALAADVGTVQQVHNLALDTSEQLKVAAATAALWADKDAALARASSGPRLSYSRVTLSLSPPLL
jgi:hypothetical protein